MNVCGLSLAGPVLAFGRQKLEVFAYVAFVGLDGVRRQTLLGGKPGREVFYLSFRMP
jgi:hypothetical protein